MLSEAYQQVVVFDPILFRQLFSQRKFGFVGVLGSDIAPAIRNPVNMGVHANSRFLVSERDYQIRCLSADAFEFQKLINVVGYLARIIAQQKFANLPDDLGFSAVETYGENRFLNGFRGKL